MSRWPSISGMSWLVLYLVCYVYIGYVISIFGMLFPPRSVGSALGGLKKKFDLISLKKIRTPLGPSSILSTRSRSNVASSLIASSRISLNFQRVERSRIEIHSCHVCALSCPMILHFVLKHIRGSPYCSQRIDPEWALKIGTLNTLQMWMFFLRRATKRRALLICSFRPEWQVIWIFHRSGDVVSESRRWGVSQMCEYSWGLEGCCSETERGCRAWKADRRTHGS